MDSSGDRSSTLNGSNQLNHKGGGPTSRSDLSGMYHLGRTLGRGHFAVVKLGRHVATGQLVAVKMIDKTKLDVIAASHLLQEVRCMRLVQHPNVVQLYEVIDTPSTLYLVMELAEGGDLYDYILRHEGGVAERTAKRHFAQIVRAVAYCHRLHVVHRDLKPENVVFFPQQGAVKLTDFGFSNLFQPGTTLATSCGSLAYSAPEILLGEEYDAPAVDIWSLGVILFMLVCGVLPFQETNDSETLIMILDCRYAIPEHVSQDCTDLISSMLQKDPSNRATLQEIEAHSWLQGLDDALLSPEAPPHWLTGALSSTSIRPGVPERGDLLAARPLPQQAPPGPWQPSLSGNHPSLPEQLPVSKTLAALQQICEEEEEEEEEEEQDEEQEEQEEKEMEEQEEKEMEEEVDNEMEKEAEEMQEKEIDENQASAQTPFFTVKPDWRSVLRLEERKAVHPNEGGVARERTGAAARTGAEHRGERSGMISEQPASGLVSQRPSEGPPPPLPPSGFMGIQCCRGQRPPDPSRTKTEMNNNSNKQPPPHPRRDSPGPDPFPSPSLNVLLDQRAAGGVEGKSDGERVDLLSDRAQSQSAAGSDGAAPRVEPGKGRGVKLRERLFQFPLCEKALAFNLPAHNKNKLLPLAQYNCCHVL